MGYKLIAMDMDGTLLNRDTKVSEGNAKALEDAMAAGHHVVLASGRMYASVKPFFEAMGLNAPVITYQGARVMGTRGEELYRKCVPMELAGEILAYAREKNFYIQMYWDERLFYEERTNHTDYYEAKSGIKGTALGRGAFNHLAEEPFKILCMDTAVRISEAQKGAWLNAMPGSCRWPLPNPNTWRLLTTRPTRVRLLPFLQKPWVFPKAM